METLRARAYAKINLTLDVLGRRPDGYHDVEMVMQSVDLVDELFVGRDARLEANAAPGAPALRLASSGYAVPPGPGNIIHRAAAAFGRAFGVPVGVEISLDKHIPVAAGLAGGSADAAATLLALRQLYRPDVTLAALSATGATVGADVPFCLIGGTCVVQGLGEIVSPLDVHPGFLISLVKPQFGVSTADAYRWFDDLAPGSFARPCTETMRRALAGDDVRGVGRSLANVLEVATLSRHPELRLLKEAMHACGFAGVVMSGSGPTIFGVAEGPEPGVALASDPQVLGMGAEVWPNRAAVPVGVALGTEGAGGTLEGNHLHN